MKIFIIIISMFFIGCSGSNSNSGSDPGPNDNNNTGDISLSWSQPSRMEDDSALDPDDIVAYHIYWGQSPSNLDNTIELSGSLQQYTFSSLSKGDYYFAISVETALGDTSVLSNTVSKSIQ